MDTTCDELAQTNFKQRDALFQNNSLTNQPKNRWAKCQSLHPSTRRHPTGTGKHLQLSWQLYTPYSRLRWHLMETKLNMMSNRLWHKFTKTTIGVGARSMSISWSVCHGVCRSVCLSVCLCSYTLFGCSEPYSIQFRFNITHSGCKISWNWSLPHSRNEIPETCLATNRTWAMPWPKSYTNSDSMFSLWCWFYASRVKENSQHVSNIKFTNYEALLRIARQLGWHDHCLHLRPGRQYSDSCWRSAWKSWKVSQGACLEYDGACVYMTACTGIFKQVWSRASVCY